MNTEQNRELPSKGGSSRHEMCREVLMAKGGGANLHCTNPFYAHIYW